MLMSQVIFWILLTFVIFAISGHVSEFFDVVWFVDGMSDYCGGAYIFQFNSNVVWFLFMLLACSMASLGYCHSYMPDKVNYYRLVSLMVVFIGVMMFLVLSGSLLFTLIVWEWLGVVSYLLILFYNNLASLRGAIITLFSSRMGDVCLFLIFWSVVSFGVLEVRSGYLWLFFISSVVITKSAIFPFTSWLLEAMRAPTPVSALVHSSTLVAAGVWFYINYYEMFLEWSGPLFILSIVTIFISGVSALYYKDLKKLVALSTCNNISWCILFLCSSEPNLALSQLVVHGICKCILFIIVGDGMTSSGGAQHHSGTHLNYVAGFWMSFNYFVLVGSLCGFPYLGYFFIKHYSLFIVSYCLSGLVSLLVWLGFGLSFIYSTRLLLLLCGRSSGLNKGFVQLFDTVTSYIVLCFALGWFFINNEVEDWGSSMSGCIIYWVVMSLGCFWGMILYYDEYCTMVGRWSFFLWGTNVINNMFYSAYLSISECSHLGYIRWEKFVLGNLLSLGVYSTQDGSWKLLNTWLLFGLFFFLLWAVLVSSPSFFGSIIG